MTELKSERKALVFGDQPKGTRSLFHCPHPTERTSMCGIDFHEGYDHMLTVREATSLGGIACPMCVALVKATGKVSE